jgi:hypothetical protein
MSGNTEEQRDVLVAVATLSLVFLAVSVGPAVGAAIEAQTPEPRPLSVSEASISPDVRLVQSDFGGGTYHFTPIRITLEDPRGAGTLIVQVAAPRLSGLTLSNRETFRATGSDETTVEYQPPTEVRQKETKFIDSIDGGKFPIRVTVRINNGGDTRIIAERTLVVTVVR